MDLRVGEGSDVTNVVLVLGVKERESDLENGKVSGDLDGVETFLKGRVGVAHGGGGDGVDLLESTDSSSEDVSNNASLGDGTSRRSEGDEFIRVLLATEKVEGSEDETGRSALSADSDLVLREGSLIGALGLALVLVSGVHCEELL